MRKILLYLQVIFYVMAGLNHFRKPEFYLGLIPPYLPWHNTLNTIAGIAEILLGTLLFFKPTRMFAVYGVVLLLIAFIPAHIYFIQIGSCIPNGLCVPQWVGWIRLLVIHPLLLAWACWYRK